jgi:hypothetical protein
LTEESFALSDFSSTLILFGTGVVVVPVDDAEDVSVVVVVVVAPSVSVDVAVTVVDVPVVVDPVVVSVAVALLTVVAVVVVTVVAVQEHDSDEDECTSSNFCCELVVLLCWLVLVRASVCFSFWPMLPVDCRGVDSFGCCSVALIEVLEFEATFC